MCVCCFLPFFYYLSPSPSHPDSVSKVRCVFVPVQRGVQRNQRSLFFRTNPLCPLAWTPGSSPRSLQKTEKPREASKNCGESESKPSLRAFIHTVLCRLPGSLRLLHRIRRSQSGSPAQVHDPELGDFKRGGFRSTAGPRLARPANTR